jgi:hypothetical protein
MEYLTKRRLTKRHSTICVPESYLLSIKTFSDAIFFFRQLWDKQFHQWFIFISVFAIHWWHIKAMVQCLLTKEILVLEHACLSCSCKHFGRKNPCKKSADLHPRQGNLQHWHMFTGLNKTSLHITKLGGDQLTKNSPVFFNMRVLDLDFYAPDPPLNSNVRCSCATEWQTCAKIRPMGNCLLWVVFW